MIPMCFSAALVVNRMGFTTYHAMRTEVAAWMEVSHSDESALAQKMCNWPKASSCCDLGTWLKHGKNLSFATWGRDTFGTPKGEETSPSP